MFSAFQGLDWLALLFFFGVSVGYAFSLKFQGQTYNLIKVMHRYRLQWIKHMIKRADRSLDLQILASMIRTSTIFVIVTLGLVVSLIAMFGYNSTMMPLLNQLSFTINTSFSVWSIKVSLLLGIAIFSFFKFTWVIRQLNYIAVLMVAAPIYREGMDVVHDLKRQTKYVNKIATILSNIDKHFISGIRAICFGVAVLGWFVHPLLFILLTFIIVGVLYRREFMSKTLILLS